jgi:hypothetical protein
MNTWIACIKRLKVSEMTWLLAEDDVDSFYAEIELIVRINFIRDIRYLIKKIVNLKMYFLVFENPIHIL